MNLTRTQQRGNVRRAATAALGLLVLIPSALAGTYSVAGVEWYPTTAPGTVTTSGAGASGYIYFSTPDPNYPYDVLYGLSVGASAPQQGIQNITRNATVSGIWKWRVRWVPTQANEPIPYEVLATIQYKGSANASADAMSFGPGYVGSGSTQISDDGLLLPVPMAGSMDAATSTSAMGPPKFDNDSYSGSSTKFGGAANFALVAGTTNVYEGTVLFSVTGHAQASASGVQPAAPPGMMSPIWAQGSSGSNLDARIRLTHVQGQRVQNDM